MDTIKDILSSRRIPVPTNGGRAINSRWEIAKEFGSYVGLPTLVVLRLFKIYGSNAVLFIRGWLADVPYDPARGGKIALAHWKLKDNLKKKVVTPPPSHLRPLSAPTGARS